MSTFKSLKDKKTKPIFDIDFSKTSQVFVSKTCCVCSKETQVTLIGNSETNEYMYNDLVHCSFECVRQTIKLEHDKNMKLWQTDSLIAERNKLAEIPLDYQFATIADFNESVFDVLKTISKPMVLISSQQSGVGKTHLAISILKQFLVKVNGFFTTTNNMLQELLSFDKDARKASFYKDITVLVLDDLGVEKVNNDRDLSLLYDVIDSRLNNRKITIITTNLTVDQIIEKYTQRILSRITSGHKIPMSGQDRRQ